MANLDKLAEDFERPTNNMRARVAFRLYRMGYDDAQMSKIWGVTKQLVFKLRQMHANRRNDWRDRVEN